MEKNVEILSEKPLNAQTPAEALTSWVTPNDKFFCRNQGAPFTERMDTSSWSLTVDGLVEQELSLSYEELREMPRQVVAAAIECSGNGRALLPKKARGNRWTIGGVGNAVWAGVPMSEVLQRAGVTDSAGQDGSERHLILEGAEQPPMQAGKQGSQFIRSIPLSKGLVSTLLAFEMNGEPLPAEHGFPLRALPLGWTGANSVKWLTRITVSAEPHHGFFMDKVYRVFQEGQEPEEGEPVTEMPVKSFLTSHADGDRVAAGRQVALIGVAYAGEQEVTQVDVSTNGGGSWHTAELLGPPGQAYAWRLWQYRWTPETPGEYTVMSAATDATGRAQPINATWNVLGYGNNGVREHAVRLSAE
jgi:DMSO/TMAO reductase YedYZ molybdopterin-dependent catalytic subunit